MEKICKQNIKCQIIGLTYIFMTISQIKIAENRYSDRNIDYKIKRQKLMQQELDCKFIGNDPGKKDFDIFRPISEIFKHFKQLKTTLINRIRRRIFGLKFQSDNIIKSKTIKCIATK